MNEGQVHLKWHCVESLDANFDGEASAVVADMACIVDAQEEGPSLLHIKGLARADKEEPLPA